MSHSVRSPAAVECPSGDGMPMAENDWRLRAMLDATSTPALHFAGRPDVYVSGGLFIHHEEGNPKARVAEPEASLREGGRSASPGGSVG